MNARPLNALREVAAAYWKPVASVVTAFIALATVVVPHLGLLQTPIGRYGLPGAAIFLFVIIRFPRAAIALTRVILGPAPEPPLHPRIFRGPSAYSAEDEAVFYGRQAEAEDCWVRIRRDCFLILEGESGLWEVFREQAQTGMDNVEFLKGEIEHIPLPDESVDVIISNCVINLSADKDRVLREALRVLKPGGRFAVSDVVTRGEMLPEIRQSVLLWVGCVAGALEENEYRTKLASAGFENIQIEPTRVYRVEDAREFLSGQNIDMDAIAPQVEGKFISAFVRAMKPQRKEPCCGPTCCN
jgi:hypothetical protein